MNDALQIIAATTATALMCLAATLSSAEQGKTPVGATTIVELRQYTLRPGQRDVLIDLFEREFVESQEALGMSIAGTFRDLARPDRFVWIRGFPDMATRGTALKAFYEGPVWQANRQKANATMLDSDNVLLLHAARPGSELSFRPGDRAPKGSSTTPAGLIVATIYYFERPVEAGFVEFFDSTVEPLLNTAGMGVRGSYVTELAPNNYPPLPIREHDQAFVWFSVVADGERYAEALRRLSSSADWKKVARTLRSQLRRDPEVLQLTPTPRSALHQ